MKTYLHATVLMSYEPWQIKRTRPWLPVQEMKGAVAVGRDGCSLSHWAHEASIVIFHYNLFGAGMQSCRRPPAHRHPFQQGQTRASLGAIRSTVSFFGSGSVDEDLVGKFF
jgi:hypothetical protein